MSRRRVDFQNLPQPLFTSGKLTIVNERTREIRIGRLSDDAKHISCFYLERKEPHQQARSEGWTKISHLSEVVGGSSQAKAYLEAFKRAVAEAVAQGFPEPAPDAIPSLGAVAQALSRDA